MPKSDVSKTLELYIFRIKSLLSFNSFKNNTKVDIFSSVKNFSCNTLLLMFPLDFQLLYLLIQQAHFLHLKTHSRVCCIN